MKSINPSVLVAIFGVVIVHVALHAQSAMAYSSATIKFNHGEIAVERRNMNGRFEDTFIWRTDQGVERIIERLSGKQEENAYCTVEGAFSEGGQIALIVSQGNGHLEYWRYGISHDKCELQVKAALDHPIVLKAIEFTAIDQFKFLSKRNPPDSYAVTGKPRSGDKLYREVMKNGLKLEAPSFFLSSELAATKPSELQGGRPPATSSPADPVKSSSTSMASNAKSEQLLQKPPPPASWPLISLIIVAACGLLWLLLKRRL